ncbi:MAG TPA: chalcone isomerase family protein [Myxococcota bacterium]|nr:chalcone isomerase family protein [Myxococcota bacterium]HRY92075.1 chalcone isomerase family protein [Myxococcota bacterium]HSA23223.1 chalcone isomerase family protein [Myxococcota bacterium]
MRRRAFGFLAVALISATALAAGVATVEGKTYQPTLSQEGKELKLLGAGLREKWFVDVYVMAAYSESGSCATADIVAKDEPKYLRMDLLRDVSAEKMADTIGGSFEEHMPANASEKLKAQRKTFEGYFKDECTEGTVLEFFYLPGTGTLMKQNGKQLGPVLDGFDFARVLWDIYFGKETCCEDMKIDILKHCRGK